MQFQMPDEPLPVPPRIQRHVAHWPARMVSGPLHRAVARQRVARGGRGRRRVAQRGVQRLQAQRDRGVRGGQPRQRLLLLRLWQVLRKGPPRLRCRRRKKIETEQKELRS